MLTIHRKPNPTPIELIEYQETPASYKLQIGPNTKNKHLISINQYGVSLHTRQLQELSNAIREYLKDNT